MAVSTLNYNLVSSAYTDLGALPLQVQVAGGNAGLVISSGQPPVTAPYMTMGPDTPITSFATAGAHLWGLALAGAPTVITNPTA